MVPRILVGFALLASVPAAASQLATPTQRAQAASSLTLSRYVVAPADTFVLSGRGFTAGAAVTVSLRVSTSAGAKELLSTLSANGGTFRLAVTMPANASPGTYTVVARDTHGHRSTANVTVLPKVLVRAGHVTGTTWVQELHDFYVSGSGFGAGDTVRISIPFPLFDGNQIVLSRSVKADGNGAFHEILFRVPAGAKHARVTLLASGASTGRRGSGYLRVFYHPILFPSSASVRRGTSVVINGTSFVPNTRIRVAMTIGRFGSESETITKRPLADGSGNFQTSLYIALNTRLGTYTVVADDSAGALQAKTSIRVLKHTSPKPKPTATATPTPTATATPTPQPKHHHRTKFGFKWISLWYHTLRVGTWDRLIVQTTLTVKIGIWVHVYFPSGGHLDYFENSNKHGRWSKTFTVQPSALSGGSNRVLITMRLWHGQSSRREFTTFRLVR